MVKKHIKMAICYDFDGTLAPGNLQEYSFIKKLGMTPSEFWGKSNGLARAQKADNIASYMYRMREEALAHGLPFKRADLRQHGANVTLFPGVAKWFDRINAYAAEKGVVLEHYIISSGIKEMIEGTPIAPFFREIFASSYMYDKKGNAVWPGLAVNYTNKTQFLYRVNKGLLDVSDNDMINRHMDDHDKPIPFQNIIYIGDGETDVPSMKTVKREGGHTIAVYPIGSKEKQAAAHELLGIGRADIIAPGDYRANKAIDVFVRTVISKTVVNTYLKNVCDKCNREDA